MDTLTVLARYTLNREAGDVALEFYGPDLEPLGSLTGQTVDAGTNWSDVETLTGVQFDANGDLVGPIYCVAFATETAEDGELNRDRQPKPGADLSGVAASARGRRSDEHSSQPPMAGTPRCTGCQYEHSLLPVTRPIEEAQRDETSAH